MDVQIFLRVKQWLRDKRKKNKGVMSVDLARYHQLHKIRRNSNALSFMRMYLLLTKTLENLYAHELILRALT